MLNNNIESLYCIKCSKTYTVADYFVGCPSCLENGMPASLSFKYNNLKAINTKELFPYLEYQSLGEGNTPTIPLANLSDELEVKVWVKNEGQNPTGSHKDRMSPFIIQRALDIGAKTIAVASSGNAGVSIATYAAANNLECVVLTTEEMNPIWKQAIQLTGCKLQIKNTAMDRWDYMKKMVEQGSWYPATNFINPPVGSNPFGVQGYKAIAFEIIRDFSTLPDFIILPNSRGDLLWGIWEGLKEAFEGGFCSKLPKLIAVEPFPRLKSVINGVDYTHNFDGDSTNTPSVGGTTVTYQSLKAITESNGEVIVIPTNDAEHYQRKLAKYGIYAERSSALVLGALLEAVKTTIIQKNQSVLMLITSNGYKECL